MVVQARMLWQEWSASLSGRRTFSFVAAILAGVILGFLTIFVPPLYLVFGLGGLLFAYLLFFHIESAIVVVLLVFHELRDFNDLGGGTPIHPNGLIGLGLIVAAVFFFAFHKIDYSRLIAIKFFAGFVVVAAISLLFTSDYLMEGITVTLRLVSGLALYAVLVYKTDSIRKVSRVLAAILIALLYSTITGLILIAQGQGEKYYGMETARLGGGSSGPGAYLAMISILCVVFFLDAKTSAKRLLWGSISLVLVTGLFFSYGRAGWIGFAAGLFIIGLLKYKKILFILPGALLLVILLVPAIAARFSDISISDLNNRNSSTLAVRVELWRAGLDVYRAHNPLFGVGYGIERYRIGEYLSQYAWMAHNDYVAVLVGTGIVGLILFLMWHAQWLLETYRVFKSSTIDFDKTLALGVFATFFVSLVVRITDNVVQSTGGLYPLAALVAITLALPRIRANENSHQVV